MLVEHIADLRTAVRITRNERPFAITAWVVRTDHLHCIWTLPEGDTDYSIRLRLIGMRFSRAVPIGELRASHVRRQERGIWQRRFWEHHIRNQAGLAGICAIAGGTR